MVEEKLENSLYWAVSLALNLVIFTLLSLYLSVKVDLKNPTPPLEVFLQETPEVKEVKLAAGKRLHDIKPHSGQALVSRGKASVSSSPIEAHREVGDVQVPAGKPQEEPSLLEHIEQKIRGREREVEKEGTRSADIGNITAIVSPGGVGLSGGGRATVYTPPFPKISSDEPLSPLRVRVWIDPSGVVSRVQIIQKSGSPQVDQKMLEFARGIRFEPIRENLVQTGIITFRFKGG